MTCAPRGISSTKSSSVGRSAMYDGALRALHRDALGLADELGVRR